MAKPANPSAAAESPSSSTITIWTLAYRPFIMGGDVHAPVGARVAALGPYDLGKGFEGYVVIDPFTGASAVAEASSGALVGPDLSSVRADIAAADEAVMRRQVEESLETRKKVHVLDAEAFWKLRR